MVLFGVGLRTGVKNRHRKFILSACTYSINDFDAKVYVVVLQQRQDWEAPKIKDLKHDIPDHDAFIASDSVFNCAWYTQEPF